jgi:hypothetical protein
MTALGSGKRLIEVRSFFSGASSLNETAPMTSRGQHANLDDACDKPDRMIGSLTELLPAD